MQLSAPPSSFDLVKLGAHAVFELRRQRLDCIRAAKGIDHVGQSGLLEDHLLGPAARGLPPSSVGTPSASSYAEVWSVWTPPRTAARAFNVTLTTFTNGC